MPRLYATLEEYRAYVGEPAATLTDRQLRSASLLVGLAVRGAWYRTDADGLPTDAAVATAMREATCEVLAHRSDTGVTTPLTAAGLKSATIGSATYVVADQGGTGGYYLLPGDAHLILEEAGLRGGPVTVCG